MTRLLNARPGFGIVGAYTRNPQLAGRDMGVHAGVPPIGVEITTDWERALAQPANLLLVATSSFLKDVADDVRAGIEHGLNVITTAEEAAFPWLTDEKLADELDQLAKNRRVSVLGVGLNPGFIFDALLLTVTGIAWDVQRIRVRRVVDMSRFSAAIKRRSGIGFSREKFEAGVESKSITGHIGFPESFSLAAKCLGQSLDHIEESFEPLLAKQTYDTEQMKVEVGQTGGFIQHSAGIVDGEEWFTAEFIAHVDPESIGFHADDSISIEGYHPIKLSINPGCNPQLGTAGMISSCIPRVVEAEPGFLTVADLAIPFARKTVGKEPFYA